MWDLKQIVFLSLHVYNMLRLTNVIILYFLFYLFMH